MPSTFRLQVFNLCLVLFPMQHFSPSIYSYVVYYRVRSTMPITWLSFKVAFHQPISCLPSAYFPLFISTAAISKTVYICLTRCFSIIFFLVMPFPFQNNLATVDYEVTVCWCCCCYYCEESTTIDTVTLKKRFSRGAATQ